MRRIVAAAVMLAASLFMTACGSIGVKPWQRDVLSRPDMRPDGNLLDDAIDDHVYFSKEGSSGGRSFAGGGCGCN